MARNPKEKPVVIRRGRRYDPGPQLKLFEADGETGGNAPVPEGAQSPPKAAPEPQGKPAPVAAVTRQPEPPTEGDTSIEVQDPAVAQFCELIARVIARGARRPKNNEQAGDGDESGRIPPG